MVAAVALEVPVDETAKLETVCIERTPGDREVTTTIHMKVPGGWLYLFSRARRRFIGVAQNDSMVFVPEPPRLQS